MKTIITITEGQTEPIIDFLEGLTNESLMIYHNIYCEQKNDTDSQIFHNDDEFFEIFFNGRQSELIRACEYGDHRFTDDYVKFNGYANLESFNDVIEQVDFEAIANCILENERHFDIILDIEEEEQV